MADGGGPKTSDWAELLARRVPLEMAAYIAHSYRTTGLERTAVSDRLDELCAVDAECAFQTAHALVEELCVTDWLGMGYHFMYHNDAFLMVMFDHGHASQGGMLEYLCSAKACIAHINRVLAHKPDKSSEPMVLVQAVDGDRWREINPLELCVLDQCPKTLDYDICRALVVHDVQNIADLSPRFVNQLVEHHAPVALSTAWCQTLPQFAAAYAEVQDRRKHIGQLVRLQLGLPTVLAALVAAF